MLARVLFVTVRELIEMQFVNWIVGSVIRNVRFEENSMIKKITVINLIPTWILPMTEAVVVAEVALARVHLAFPLPRSFHVSVEMSAFLSRHVWRMAALLKTQACVETKARCNRDISVVSFLPAADHLFRHSRSAVTIFVK